MGKQWRMCFVVRAAVWRRFRDGPLKTDRMRILLVSCARLAHQGMAGGPHNFTHRRASSRRPPMLDAADMRRSLLSKTSMLRHKAGLQQGRQRAPSPRVKRASANCKRRSRP